MLSQHCNLIMNSFPFIVTVLIEPTISYNYRILLAVIRSRDDFSRAPNMIQQITAVCVLYVYQSPFPKQKRKEYLYCTTVSHTFKCFHC